MTAYLVAIHILVDTDAANPRSAVASALESQFERCAAAVPAAGMIVDWAVAEEDLAASMTPVVIPSDYTPGATPFPDWSTARGEAQNNDRIRRAALPPDAILLSADARGRPMVWRD